MLGVFLTALFGISAWAKQKKWEIRKDLYIDLLKSLDTARRSLIDMQDIQEHLKYNDDESKDLRLTELQSTNTQARQDVQQAIDRVGILFLSKNSLDILETYLQAEHERISSLKKGANQDNYAEVSAEIHSWDLYIDNEIDAANRAYNEIVNLARYDLRMVIEPSVSKRMINRFEVKTG